MWGWLPCRILSRQPRARLKGARRSAHLGGPGGRILLLRAKHASDILGLIVSVSFGVCQMSDAVHQLFVAVPRGPKDVKKKAVASAV